MIEENDVLDEKQLKALRELDLRNEKDKQKLAFADKNIDFIQIYRDHCPVFRDLAKKSNVATQVLFLFMEYCGKHNNAICISYKAMSELLGYSRQTLKLAIDLLEEESFIQKIKVSVQNVYIINERIAWQNSRSNRQYAIFSATVVATETEQSQKIKDEINKKTNKMLRNVPTITTNLDLLNNKKK